jgi:hypothetical protein
MSAAGHNAGALAAVREAASPDLGAPRPALARLLLQGRRRYVVWAAIIALWLSVAIVVALATAGGLVWV